MIWTILILIFVLVIASTWWFGLWSNFITLVNLVLAGLIATSFYSNVVALLLKWMETYAVLIEFVSFWLTFAVAFIVLRAATDFLSSIRLKFDNLTELIGRSLLSVAIAVVFVCIACFSLQLAPLPPHLFISKSSSFKTASTRVGGTPEQIQAKLDEEAKAVENMMVNRKFEEAVGPDRLWISTVRMLSRNSLSTSRDQGLFYGADTREITVGEKPYDFQGVREFDPLEMFFVDATQKRRDVSRQKVLRVVTDKK